MQDHASDILEKKTLSCHFICLDKRERLRDTVKELGYSLTYSGLVLKANIKLHSLKQQKRVSVTTSNPTAIYTRYIHHTLQYGCSARHRNLTQALSNQHVQKCVEMRFLSFLA